MSVQYLWLVLPLLWWWVGGSAAISLRQDSSIVSIRVMPKVQYVSEGTTALLECLLTASQEDSYQNLEYSWFRNGTKLVLNAGHYVQRLPRPYSADLFIRDFQAQRDSGQYECIVTNLQTGARLSSSAATLNQLRLVSVDIRVLEQLRNSVILFCDVKSNAGQLPSADTRVTWYRNHHQVETDSLFSVDHFRMRIKVSQLDAAEAEGEQGIRCGVHSEAGVMFSPTFDLTTLLMHINDVEAARKKDRHSKRSSVDSGPRQMHYQADETVLLSCRLPASGDGVIVWKKDGKFYRTSQAVEQSDPLAENNNFRDDARIQVMPNNNSLIISRSMGADEGLYNCESVATASGETIKQGVFYAVHIEYKLKFVPTPTSKKIELGMPGKVHCKAQGTPWPDVRWFKGANDELDDGVEDYNGTLHFRNVSKSHAGNYTCMATNSQGHISATIKIQVVMSPRFVVAPVGPILARENETVLIHCQAIGDPIPTIQWDKDLTYLTFNNSELDARVRLLENGSLYIASVQPEDEGNYGCTIGNSGGLKREETNLSISLDGAGGDDDFTVTKALLVTMALATTYIVFVAILMMWCRYKRRGGGDENMEGASPFENDPTGDENKMNEIDPFVQPLTDTNSTSRDGNPTSNGATKRAPFNVDSFVIERSAVMDMVSIGRGEFGDVFVGMMSVNDVKAVRHKQEAKPEEEVCANGKRSVAKDEVEGEIGGGDAVNGVKASDNKHVLVKALKQKEEGNKLAVFNKQMELFGTVQHRNVVKLYGVCTEKSPQYMVLEYTDWGDLKQFLIATSTNPTKDKKLPPLNLSQTLTLAHQICRGMDAINKYGFLHKDLATRNCIISSLFVAKVSLPALSKDKYASEYARFRDQLVAVRWCAPEVLQQSASSELEFNVKTEVWSYGVCVWELFNQATQLPFHELSNEDYIKRVTSGQNGEVADRATMSLQLPTECPDTIRELVHKCWSLSASDRPTFSQLTSAIITRLKSEYVQEGDN